MVGINPADPTTHLQYHLSQGLDADSPPLCIMKGTCHNMRHYLVDCPNITSDEQYHSEWTKWVQIQERVQHAQWDNHYTMIQVNAPGAGPPSHYTNCKGSVATSEPDAHLKESTSLTNKPICSADSNIEVGNPMKLDTPNAHSIPTRMVARTRKRPLTTTAVDAHVDKKHKTFDI